MADPLPLSVQVPKMIALLLIALGCDISGAEQGQGGRPD
jgi:hypothetical protein